MLHHLEQLQQRPEHHRRAIAFGVATTLTGVIALTWIASMSGKLSSFEGTTANVREAASAASQSLQVEGQDPGELFERFRTQANELRTGGGAQ